MPENFYDLLGVSDDATQAELKAAYRAKAREYHPDVNDDDRATAQFQTIRRAYDVLSDESERADYERLGHRTYVKKRMKGYPSASRWGDDEDSSSSPSSSGSSGASSRSSRAGTSKSSSSASTTSASRSSTARSASASGTASSTSSTGTSRGRSNRRSSGRTAGGSVGGHDPDAADARAKTREARRARRRQQRRQNQVRSSRRRTLLHHWTAVFGATILYVAGVAQYLFAQLPALDAFASELASAPSVATLRGSYGLDGLLPFVLEATQTPTATPEALLFPVGAVALPLSLVVTVRRFGSGTTWLYAVGALAPTVALGLSAALAPMVALVLLLAVVVPVLSATWFLGDVGRYLWATR
ncbi:DnaJ domain-containing protein [Haloprofundus sp. MHR1]|uniref:DnaJ domain-containing protein n=1 Tax=Haloprofundus sp. MHR1 TaxID=2572921 RepID=UPI0010BEB21E|nr:DnaJ domain-containing protein [Haloprofundus sp. MHR1]QCJ47825.1 molecular chaperone DnaJ [Haloprofundus sp. MHR1]